MMINSLRNDKRYPDNWFLNIFGFRESVENVYKYINCKTIGDNVIMRSEANGRQFNTGNFSIRNVSSFNFTKRGGGKLNIIIGTENVKQRKDLIDVLLSQSLPENDGATYLAASNFNALEFTSSMETARKGITNYAFDYTQGPYCALAAPQSALYRNYFLPVGNGIGQIENEINLLSSTPIKVLHGYAQIGEKDLAILESLRFDWDNLSNYNVAVHRNNQLVMSRGEKQTLVLVPDTNRIIHHVYAAAFDFSYSVIDTPFTRYIASNLLEAQYRCAILSAWENYLLCPDRLGSNKLYLTLLGGGVFKNSHQSIAEAIKKCAQLIIDSGLEVNIVCYSPSSGSKVEPILRNIVAQTGGSTIFAD